MYTQPANAPDRKPWTVPMLAEAKREGRRLAMLTAYDAGFARAMDAAGVDLVLVGDSLGMVMQGRDSTLPVTVDDIVYHTGCVARGLSSALLLSDLPFQADATPMRALDAATRCLQAGAGMAKLEGAGHKLEVIRHLVEREIPVCGHLGLTPQSVLRLGGYKVQGRDDRAAAQLLEDARAGAYVEPENIGEYNRIIREYLAEPSRIEREGESGYRYARENFDREVLAKKYLDHIKGITR